MKKRKTSLFSVVVLRVIIITIIPWLLLMSLFTWAVAKDFYQGLEIGAVHWANDAGSRANDKTPLLGLSQTLSDGYIIINSQRRSLPILYDLLDNGYGSSDWFWGNWELMYGFQAAIQIDDEELDLSLRSGDYIFFTDLDGNNYCIDLSRVEGGREFADRYISDDPRGNHISPSLTPQTTYTGYLDGYLFYPTQIQSNHLDHSFPAPDTNQSLLKLTSPKNSGIFQFNYDPGKAFQWQGKTYQNAAKLLDEENLKTGFNLLNSVISVNRAYKNRTVKVVVYCSPLKRAFLQTWHIWLISVVLIAVFLILHIRRVYQNIITPIKIANQQYAFNNKTLDISINTGTWELDLLGKHIEEAQLDRHAAHNRIQQLETALNYAKEAEENRRRLINALAHELKTPLAVVHGYAEGLQEGIAEDKKAHYLSVLLEESEKMDAMVKEMLDFSRLEAGKVTLDTEQFSLNEMTTQVFDRLTLSARQRDLTVLFEQTEELTVMADKNRIRQVITNLADNAIKYTTRGGNIRVLVYKKYGSAWLAIENDCEPFSQDALEHIWDSFYRMDVARSSSGTGLGLAIVKSIVTLHRGSCYVQNTKTGVRFSFSIPM